MKKIKIRQAYLLFIFILSVFLAAGCSGGESGHTAATNTKVTFTVPVTVVAPGVPTSDVAVNTKITATFSDAMDPATITSATFTLKQGTTAVAGTVTYSGVTAVFTPASNLAAAATHTATVTTGARDLSGNALSGDYAWSFTTGAAADTTAPTVTATINANGATNVPTNTKIAATFSKAMDPLTINAETVTFKQGATAVPGTVTYSGVTAVFTPVGNLAANTTYTGTVTTGAADLAGNPMASDFVISWTTGASPDTTPPAITATINANGATGVPINTEVGATFSEAMDPLTITTKTFTLKQGATAVAGTVIYSGVSAVFTAARALAANTIYTATITTGARDLAGNALTSDYVWSWTTGTALDTAAPIVTGTINASGATGVPINTKVGATFSEAMDPLTITNLTFTLKQGATAVAGTVTYSGVNAVFIPASNLAVGTTYTATITKGARDLAGNALTSDYVWSWTTGAAPDTNAPTVTLTLPADAATGVVTNTTLTATFSEAMDPLTITTTTFTLKQGATAVAGTVTYSGVNAVFTPAGNLAAGTTYTATITTGATDLAGNALAIAFNWTFSTSVIGSTASFCEQSFTQTDHFIAASSINGQNGWTSSGGFDQQVATVGAIALAGQNVWKLSNKVISTGFAEQPLSPQLSESAGESTVRSAGGGDAMETVFWLRPLSSLADGSAITLSMSPSNADRQTYFRIENNLDANGGNQIRVIDYFDVQNTNNYRTFVTATGISRTAWTKVRLVMETPDGSTNDVFQIFLNDQLVGTYSTWEDYHTWPLGGNSVTEAVTRLLFRVSVAPSAVDASFINANAQGFYFDNLCYRVYNRATPGSTIQFYRTGFEP